MIIGWAIVFVGGSFQTTLVVAGIGLAGPWGTAWLSEGNVVTCENLMLGFEVFDIHDFCGLSAWFFQRNLSRVVY
jgi:hypothetical protein